MDQLESIIEQIESGEIGLEHSLTSYEQGVALVERCRSILGQAEQRVRKLRSGAESSLGETQDALSAPASSENTDQAAAADTTVPGSSRND